MGALKNLLLAVLVGFGFTAAASAQWSANGQWRLGLNNLGGTVTEDTSPKVSKKITPQGLFTYHGGGATHPRPGLSAAELERVQSITAAAFTKRGEYGSLRIEHNGEWTYELDSRAQALNRRSQADFQLEQFTILVYSPRYPVESGSSEFIEPIPVNVRVNITVYGRNDPAEFSGNLRGRVTTDRLTDSGNVIVRDIDSPDTTTASTGPCTYGDFSINNQGNWDYSLTNTAKATEDSQANGGRPVTDNCPITSADGTASTVAITVAVVDAPPIAMPPDPRPDPDQPGMEGIRGDRTGSVVRGGETRATGRFTTDTGFTITEASRNQRGDFGCLTIDPDGSWTYLLYGVISQCQPAVQAQVQPAAASLGQAETDIFMVQATKGSEPDLETVTLTLTITIGSADAITQGYLQGRASVLLGNQPDLAWFLQDLRTGTPPRSHASLQLGDDAITGFEGRFAGDTLWGALSVARSEQGSAKRDQIFGTLGYHNQISETTLAGVMLQFDQSDERLDADLGSLDGQGWLAGPYFVAQPLTYPLTFEGRLLYGQTSNEARTVGGRTGEFDTQRLLASFRVEGEVLLDYGNRAVRLVPHFNAGWIEDEAEAFRDNRGTQVSSQIARFGEVALGSDIEVPLRFGQRDATFTGGLSLISSRSERAAQDMETSISDTRGRLELGLDYRLASGMELEIGGSYDDVDGAESSDKFSLSFGVRNQF